MQGRMCLKFAAVLFSLATLVSGCSSKSLLTADCHNCTEAYEWKSFSWSELEGSWKGNFESMKSDRENPRKVRSEKNVAFRFLGAPKFFEANKISACAGLTDDSVVLNGVLWEKVPASGKKEFDAFVPGEEGSVAYGRVQFEKVNGDNLCRFYRLGRVMGTNRLSLPTISFSQTSQNRALASTGTAPETEISVEFLRFDSADAAKKQAFTTGRRPASVKAQERPPLMFRVYKVTSRQKAGEAGSEWLASDEQIFRLWKTE